MEIVMAVAIAKEGDEKNDWKWCSRVTQSFCNAINKNVDHAVNANE